MDPVIRLPRSWYPADSVDEWGRDAHLIELLTPAAKLRWDVTVGGVHHLPKRAGALLVTNSRHFSLSTIYSAWALSQAIGRPVRFGGRPDIAPARPVHAATRWLLVNKPTRSAARCAPANSSWSRRKGTRDPRHAGPVDPALVGAAVVSGTCRCTRWRR